MIRALTILLLSIVAVLADFSEESQTVAVAPEIVSDIEELRAAYGADLSIAPRNPASPTLRVIMGHRDREGSDDLRAALLGETVAGIPLTDGRIAFTGHWALDLIAAWEADLIPAEELTPAQLAALTPDPEETDE